MKSKKRGRSSTSSKRLGRRKRNRRNFIFIPPVRGDQSKRMNFSRVMDAPGGDFSPFMKAKTAIAFGLLAALFSSADAASPFKKSEGNRLLHVPSNIVFPAKIGLFDRIDTHVYGAGGRDVSVRYQLD